MQISKKSVYAIKSLLYISAYKDKRLCTINEIAEHEDIPREYLAKILKELSKKGFLTSFKGVKGGYRLTKSRNEITFLDVIKAIHESKIWFGNADKKKSLLKGASFDVWNDILNVIEKMLSSKTFDEIDYAKYFPESVSDT